MATRQSIEQFIQQCEDSLRYAQEQMNEGSKQEFYHDEEFTNAMQNLEETYNDLLKLYHSANAQQREQLHRMRLQIQQMQTNMILVHY
ncbi:YtzC family protein [Bacillus aquiflavi]|uniref:YtzC family protein n=1 Tax=Bacillus aquiflavi TaxID=2672567 RepID=A0A6B3VZV3_9BACI|nr:YtzC family protein [Bacillus aquiflavi]MBA4536896.1 YtzC family protein [Bacillus aquiflavi]NEY81263.1 YtzC family protein [Bacillus aquiflavi]